MHMFFLKHAGETCVFVGSCLEIQKFQNSDISWSMWLPAWFFYGISEDRTFGESHREGGEGAIWMVPWQN